MKIFPPFDPDGSVESGSRKRLRAVPLRMLVPNLVTILALSSGLTALRMALENRMELAVIAILFAAFLDGIDGRVARLMKSSTRFGAEMDSLADFFNFGVAPPMILYVWTLHELKTIGWVAVILFVVCMALRLARFNVSLSETQNEPWKTRYFVGVPAPAAAITVLFPVYLQLIGFDQINLQPEFVLTYVVIIAVLVVSRVPTFSGKRSSGQVPREFVLPLIFFVLAISVLLLSMPWHVLAISSMIYLLSLPYSVYCFSRMRAKNTNSTTPPTSPV